MAPAPEYTVLDGNVVNASWNDIGVLELDAVVHVWLGSLQRVSPELFLGFFVLARCRVKYFYNQNLKDQELVFHPCVDLHREKKSFQLL